MTTRFDSLSGNASMWNYNSLDCVFTREVGEVSGEAINDMGLREVDNFQHRLFPAVLHAMLRGVRVDHSARRAMDQETAWEIEKRSRYLKRVLGFDLNPRSRTQMQALFYEDLGLPIIWKKRPDGGKSPTLDDKALSDLALREPLIRPIVRTIQEERSLNVFLSTFIRSRLDDDERMRCSYNICGTETYRLSSSKNAFGSGTNLQNVPKGGEDDDSDLELPNIRKIFIPDEGMTFFDIDLSKADLRIVVWESDCHEMKSMLAEGRDPYVETAREFHHDPTITKIRPDGSENPKYKQFKSFCHGTHYLGTPHGLSQRLGISVHEATRTQAWYFGKYPAIKEWQGRFIETIKRTHRVSNKFGFVKNYLGRIDESTFREAIAWLPQSTVGILINKIWVALFEAGIPSFEVLLQVHDSLAGQFLTAQTEKRLADIRRLAQVVIPYDDPLIIPVGIKTSTESWGACG